ncbi:sugar phosphate isomerase/epimerase family protein [Bacteroidota bacterium]
MKNKRRSSLKRRDFIKTTVTVAAGIAVGPEPVFGAPVIIKNWGKPDSLINGVQIGVITYSYRSLPDQSAEATLKYVVDSGISAIELMGDPAENFAGKPENKIDQRTYRRAMRRERNDEGLTEEQKKELDEMRTQMDAYNKEVAVWRSTTSMDKFQQLKKMYEDAGVSIFGFKPSAFRQRNTDAEIDYGFRAAKALGATHVTVELPEDNAHTKKLGDFAARHKIYMAYHGHEQQTPTWWDTALDQSEYNAMNFDIGHYVAAGNPDPLKLIKAKHQRISSMHLKDRKTPENGKANLPWGMGDTPIIKVLMLMSKKKYKFPATVELEYDIPEGSDPITEVAKCLEFCRKGMSKR